MIKKFLTTQTTLPIILLLLISPIHSTTYTPIMIVELFRHGARAAGKNSLKEKYVDLVGPGNIMGNGQRMHYILGRQIRKEYPKLFQSTSTEINYKDYLVYSTDYQRTILSAYSHLSGLYPPGTGLKISNGAKEQNEKVLKYITPPYEPLDHKKEDTNFAIKYGVRPIPIHILEKEKDKIFMKAEEKTCPVGFGEITTSNFKRAIKEKTKDFKDLTDKLLKLGFNPQEIFGQKEFDLQNLGWFGDMAKCRAYFEANGSSFPKIDEETLKKLSLIFGIYYINYRYNNEKMVKTFTTEMTNLITKTIKDRIDNKNSLKYLGLSGHEANIFPFMMQYKLLSEECLMKKYKGEKIDSSKICYDPPEFAANFIWELSQDGSSNYYVRGKYNNQIVRTCDTPVDAGYCKFDEFKTYMGKHFLLSSEEYTEFCYVRSQTIDDLSGNFFVMGSLVLFGISLALSVIGFFLYKKYKKLSSNGFDQKDKAMNEEIYEEE